MQQLDLWYYRTENTADVENEIIRIKVSRRLLSTDYKIKLCEANRNKADSTLKDVQTASLFLNQAQHFAGISKVNNI